MCVEVSVNKKTMFASSLIYFVVVCIFVTLRMLSHFGVLNFLGEYGKEILNGTLQIGVLFLFSIFTFKIMTKKPLKNVFEEFSYRKISFRIILISLGIGVVVYFLNIFVASFFNAILSSVGYEFSHTASGSTSIWTLISGLVFSAILPAICEENLHRGMLLNGYDNLGIKNNILLTGFLFGLLHMNIEQFFYATIIGFLLNFVAYITGSIYPAMIIHFLNNGIGVLLSYLSNANLIKGGIFTKLSELTASNMTLGFVVIFILVLTLIFLLYYLIRLLLKYSFEDEYKEKQKLAKNLAIRIGFFSDIEKIKNGEYDGKSAIDEMTVISLEELKERIKENPEGYIVPRPKKEKMELRTKILLIASIVLMSAVTIFTFIWGII